jgi:CRISPR-associated endonuclease/helicase Cas3
MTDDLMPDEFRAFFQAVHGVSPFPWQERLLRVIADDKWPAVLDLPTGSGKTAAVDVAVFHLAMEAHKREGRRAAIRIAFVVDRRLIVDDTYNRAKIIETVLAEAARTVSASEVLRKVATRLSRLAEREDRPLIARRLRGGAPREDDWARTPSQPTILCSTVDQVGSRLLFRSYGISDRMKPIHAGLLGSDCLILLDEAHLAEPFRQTTASITNLRRKDAITAPWNVVLLSATPGDRGQIPFSLGDDDRTHRVLARRLNASKPAALIEITGKQGVPAEDRRIEEIVNHVRRALEILRRDLPNPAIGVVVNRVMRARQVFERLRTELSDTSIILIIGPARSIDREELVKRDLQPVRTGQERGLEKPLIIVATQTIEAGVDIDFDGLVTEAAALDSLRQRFGRLNRAGRDIAPVATILAHREDVGSRADDPVYGDRIRCTWSALNEVAAESSEGLVEFGTAGFPGRLAENSNDLAAKKEDAPILLPAYADVWSQTSPIPNADPEVSLFLHGADRSPASVQIIWRTDIVDDDLDDRDRVAALLELIPPRSAEAIEIPLWAARAWLREETAAQIALSDITERGPEEMGGRRGKCVFRYAGSDDERRTRGVFADELRNGDLVVAPAVYGGCDQWGWAPNSTNAVMDMAEEAAMPYAGRRFAARVTPQLIQQFLIDEQRENDQEATTSIDLVGRNLCATLAEHRDESAPELLDAVLDLQYLPAATRRSLELLKHSKGKRLERLFAYGHDIQDRPRGVVFLALRGIEGSYLETTAEYEGGAPATEDDWLGSTPGYAQTLDDHSCEVRDRAFEFSGNAGVKPQIADDLALAAYLHDAGKADPRFQTMLYGGDWFAVDNSKILAKSEKRVSPVGWTKAGLPERWRHEALSVRIARDHARFHEANDPELVLWLIWVHHGYGRPLFPHGDPWDERDRNDLVNIDGSMVNLKRGAGPQSLAFCLSGRDWTQIFEDLKRRYGPWELARLEAIVRLADHRASEDAGRQPANGHAS